jgi:hypothetical protein
MSYESLNIHNSNPNYNVPIDNPKTESEMHCPKNRELCLVAQQTAKKTSSFAAALISGFAKGVALGLASIVVGSILLMSLHVFTVLVIPVTIGVGLIGAAMAGVQYAIQVMEQKKKSELNHSETDSSDQNKIELTRSLSESDMVDDNRLDELSKEVSELQLIDKFITKIGGNSIKAAHIRDTLLNVENNHKFFLENIAANDKVLFSKYMDKLIQNESENTNNFLCQALFGMSIDDLNVSLRPFKDNSSNYTDKINDFLSKVISRQKKISSYLK